MYPPPHPVLSAADGEADEFTYTASFGSREPFSAPHTVTVLLVLAALIAYAGFSFSSPGAQGFSRVVVDGKLDSVTISAGTIQNVIKCVQPGGRRGGRGVRVAATAATLPSPVPSPCPTLTLAQSTPLSPCSGIWAAVAIGLIFSAEHLRDTLFIRPHPAVWRFVTGVGLLYTMFFAWLLFQNVEDIRQLMPFFDRKVTGLALPARNYAEECALTWPNVKGAVFDEFVIAHTVGWIFKHMMLRDLKLSFLLSFVFELMEYTFEFLQPNFAECVLVSFSRVRARGTARGARRRRRRACLRACRVRRL